MTNTPEFEQKHMLKHQQIRETHAEVRALYAAGVISTLEFVSTMNQLKADLDAEEKKLYSVDRRGHLDLLQFITGTIPDAFTRIHARFPHLSFPEVIAFEQKMRESGGSVITHSGVFAPTERMTSDTYCDGRYSRTGCTIVSWTCCHSSIHGECGYVKYVTRPSDLNNGKGLIKNGIWTSGYSELIPCDISTLQPSACDLTNPNPIGRCDTPVNFSLWDDKTAQAKDSCASETLKIIKLATQTQIDETEMEIARLRKKVATLGNMMTSIDRFV